MCIFFDGINFKPTEEMNHEQTKYQINSDNIKSNSEETSAISSISYEIENANNNDLNNASIQTQIEILKSQNSFPKPSYLKVYH